MLKTLSDIRPASWAKAALYSLLLFTLYHSSLLFLLKQWEREDYTYCWLIPFIVVYLLWEKKEVLSKITSSPSWLGFIPILFGLCLFWVGELGGEYFSLYLSSWLVFAGILWISLGWKKLKAILFAVFFLLAMFPFPNFIYTNVSLKLKLISTQLGVYMMRLYGMSAFREGNVIDLGFTQLQVVDACSGLRYLIPLIVLGVLLAYFFKASWWKKVALVASTIPISIVVNSIRIASVGILYKFWGPVVAEGFFHDFSGWFIFMISLGILVLEMGILKNNFKFMPIYLVPKFY